MRMGKRTASFACAATVIAVLACLPWSGWLVRLQLRAAAGGEMPNWAAGKTPTAGERERERQTASAHPGDFPLQLAAASQTRPGMWPESRDGRPMPDPTEETAATQTARSLWNLRTRFADNPSLYANLLRYLTADGVRIHREAELQELEPPSKETASVFRRGSARPQNTPEYLAWFDEAAAEGERLEPQNGYFPAMRSIGLFAAHRDDEALAAIHRASAKTEWREYSDDEVRGSWRLMALTYGEPGVFARYGQIASLLLFHYAPLRQATRLGTVQAIHQELNGNTGEGFQLRRDLARVGALMRTRSPLLIGSLVGNAIVETAQLRPGGAPALVRAKGTRPNSHVEEDAWESRVHETYFRYLEHIGEPQEVDFIRAEVEASKRIDSILKANNERELVRVLRPVAGGWLVGTALLSSAIVILLLGAVSIAVQGSKRLTHKLASASVISLCIIAVAGTMIFLGSSIITPWNQWLTVFQGMASYSDATVESMHSNKEIINAFLPQLAGVLALSFPVLFVLSQACRRRKQPGPRAVSFVRGIAATALPTVTVLLVVYSAAALGTLWAESKQRTEADQLLDSETTFLAQTVNQPLPGFSPGHYGTKSQDKERIR